MAVVVGLGLDGSGCKARLGLDRPDGSGCRARLELERP